MKSIHQVTAGLSLGDAVTNEALALRAAFRSWGCASEIFSVPAHIHPALKPLARDARECAAAVGPDDVAVLHLSIGSDANDLFAALPCRKAIIYHNITPAAYFEGFLDEVAEPLRRGREQAAALRGVADVVIAVSEFNARELRGLGYPDVGVVPLFLDLAKVRDPVDRATVRRYRDGHVNVLFVGRCVPNKRIEDALQAFYYFQKFVKPESRFLHAGSFVGLERYHALLLAMARDLDLERVEFAGAVRQPQLNALYRAADLFLGMSEHEGFCIPLIESMVHDVPVLAYAAGAVPETLAGSGVLFREKRFDVVAEMMGRLTGEPAFRDAVLRGQRERLARFEATDVAAALRRRLEPLL